MSRFSSAPPAAPAKRQLDRLLESRTRGTRLGAFFGELVSNSGHFLALKSLATIAAYGWGAFLSDPADYLLVAAMLLQAAYLSRSRAHRFWGNLVGVALYTAIDVPLDGWEFFSEPSHWIFWAVSLAIALLQGLRCHWWPGAKPWLVPLESIVRALTVVALYASLGLSDGRQLLEGDRWRAYLASAGHGFLASSLLLVGLMLGLQSLQIDRQRQQLQTTAKTLQTLAEWGMGRYAVAAAMTDPDALAFHRCDRAIAFMDIRGFTRWCEQTDPARVAAILNDYYRQVEPAAASQQPLRIAFTADEVMAIYASPGQALRAAIAMQAAARQVLDPWGLGAGCGLHGGSVIEGLFGSNDVRTYTAIGDAVNAAKRLESATPGGEITVSDALYRRAIAEGTVLPEGFALEPRSPVAAKGKSQPIAAWWLVAIAAAEGDRAASPQENRAASP